MIVYIKYCRILVPIALIQKNDYICKQTTLKHLFTMVNITNFGKRLEIVMEYYGLSAAGFADAITVGRSSISHILSGRNKPSLEFVMKIVEAFPEVTFQWLLNGKGKFPQRVPLPSQVDNTQKAKDLFSMPDSMASPLPLTKESPTNDNALRIERIVVFYANGTFDAYSSRD